MKANSLCWVISKHYYVLTNPAAPTLQQTAMILIREATQFAGDTVPQLGHLRYNRARDKIETAINASPWSHLMINSYE